MIVSLNVESEAWGDDFDYRDKLRDADWTKKLTGELVKDYKKDIVRKKGKTFTDAWSAV